MIELLQSFMDVFLWPMDPANLDLDNNPIMLCLTAILLGIGISRVLFDVLRGLRGCHS